MGGRHERYSSSSGRAQSSDQVGNYLLSYPPYFCDTDLTRSAVHKTTIIRGGCPRLELNYRGLQDQGARLSGASPNNTRLYQARGRAVSSKRKHGGLLGQK